MSSDIEAALAFAEENLRCEPIDVQGGKVVSIPNRHHLVDLSDFVKRERPERVVETSCHHTAKSVIDHVNQFKRPESVLFARFLPTSGTVTSIYDYHEANADEPDGVYPNWLEHKAIYQIEPSSQLVTWEYYHKEWQSQKAFVDFLQDNLLDIVEPGPYMVDTEPAGETVRAIAGIYGVKPVGPGSLFTAAKKISININTVCAAEFDSRTGASSLIWGEEHKEKGNLTVPEMFVIRIPIIEDSLPTVLPVLVTYRIVDRKPEFKITVPQLPDFIRAAMVREARLVASQTGLPLFFGRSGKD